MKNIILTFRYIRIGATDPELPQYGIGVLVGQKWKESIQSV